MHSPLSPLTPTSPLHPDGLVAPIWVRKHTTLVPSVFVLFIRLYESPPHHAPRSPLDPPHPDREAEERRKDTEMTAEIALRKKSTSERGVKLTVVLLASRKMLGTFTFTLTSTSTDDTSQTTLHWTHGSRSFGDRVDSTTGRPSSCSVQ